MNYRNELLCFAVNEMKVVTLLNITMVIVFFAEKDQNYRCS